MEFEVNIFYLKEKKKLVLSLLMRRKKLYVLQAVDVCVNLDKSYCYHQHVQVSGSNLDLPSSQQLQILVGHLFLHYPCSFNRDERNNNMAMNHSMTIIPDPGLPVCATPSNACISTQVLSANKHWWLNVSGNCNCF